MQSVIIVAGRHIILLWNETLVLALNDYVALKLNLKRLSRTAHEVT